MEVFSGSFYRCFGTLPKLTPEIKEKLKITQPKVGGLPPEILDDS